MKLEDLRPEQRMFAERVLYSVGRSPLDPIYSELIAEVVAMYDESKDQLIQLCESQKPNQVLLFRGPELYRRLDRHKHSLRTMPEFGGREVFVMHYEVPQMV